MPPNEKYPNESEEQFQSRMKLQKVEAELAKANGAATPKSEVGDYFTEGETLNNSIIAPPSSGNAGITTIGETPKPSNLFGIGGVQGAGGLSGGGVQGAGGLSGGGVQGAGGSSGSGVQDAGGSSGSGVQGAGGLSGESGPVGGKPRETAKEFSSGQRGPAGEKPETKKPEEAPYRRKRASEIGIVANRADRVRGRQKFADEIGGAGSYDKLSDEQKDRGLELGLQERDIEKYYNKQYDGRRK